MHTPLLLTLLLATACAPAPDEPWTRAELAAWYDSAVDVCTAIPLACGEITLDQFTRSATPREGYWGMAYEDTGRAVVYIEQIYATAPADVDPLDAIRYTFTHETIHLLGGIGHPQRSFTPDIMTHYAPNTTITAQDVAFLCDLAPEYCNP